MDLFHTHGLVARKGAKKDIFKNLTTLDRWYVSSIESDHNMREKMRDEMMTTAKTARTRRTAG